MSGRCPRRSRSIAVVILSAASLCVAACGSERAARRTGTRRTTTASATNERRSDVTVVMDSYYLSTCARCDGLLGSKGESMEVVRDGRRLRLCSGACIDAFDRDPRAGCEHVDAVMIADQRPHYPLTTSLVTGRPLGPSPIEFIWGNRLFRAADDAERGLLLARPAESMRLLNRAVCVAQAPLYGMPHKCPVQGDILPSDDPVDIVVANRMIRVCCGRCAHVVRARPHQYLAMVEYANRHRSNEAPP
ncbi:MAG: hypothetical protein ACKVU4_07620 [Phycisphaerales bacterium]